MEQGSQRRSMAVIKTRASGGHADYVRGSTIGASGDYLGGPGLGN